MNRKTILIVDDDPLTLELTTQIIERFGWTALTAESGEDALTLLAERGHEIDLVLLDLAMPRMDGFAVAVEIRRNPEFGDVPILALTARAEYKSQTQARESGIDAVLHKPFEIEKLRRVLETYLGPPVSRQERNVN